MSGPLRAIPFADRDTFMAQWLRGSTHFDLLNSALWFRCPCGCGGLSRVMVGIGAKPDRSPSWSWNGRLSDPTLQPSLRQAPCGWHGFLRDGYWVAC